MGMLDGWQGTREEMFSANAALNDDGIGIDGSARVQVGVCETFLSTCAFGDGQRVVMHARRRGRSRGTWIQNSLCSQVYIRASSCFPLVGH